MTWDAPRAIAREARDVGTCMFDGHLDAYGFADHGRVVQFYVGSFVARVCFRHAKELAAEIGQVVPFSRSETA